MADQTDQGILIISDGGIASLVASLMAQPSDEVALWIPPQGATTIDAPDAVIGPEHRRAAEAQADLLGLRGIDSAQQMPSVLGPQAPMCLILMMACQAAARVGMGAVVWPVVCGERGDELAAAVEIARLVERLGSVSGRFGSPWPGVELSLPLADLSPVQVAELALDLDAPVQSCWWWGEDGDGWAIEARNTWEMALRQVAETRGYPWPPSAVQNAVS